MGASASLITGAFRNESTEVVMDEQEVVIARHVAKLNAAAVEVEPHTTLVLTQVANAYEYPPPPTFMKHFPPRKAVLY